MLVTNGNENSPLSVNTKLVCLKKINSYLSPHPKAIMQPEKPVDDSFHGFPLSLP